MSLMIYDVKENKMGEERVNDEVAIILGRGQERVLLKVTIWAGGLKVN